MKVRAVSILLFALLSALTVVASDRKLPKIGELWFQDQQGAARYQRAFREGLRELGYVDGKSALFLSRFGDGDPTKLTALLKELLDQQTDVLWITPRMVQEA
jgi:putative ABC transport system substrate-binding protein